MLRHLISRWIAQLRPSRPDTAASENQLLRDIDASLADMHLITRPHAGPDVLMPERLRLLGIDAGYIARTDPALLDEMREACGECAHWRRCARDLAGGDGGAGLDAYCRNTATIDRLVLERCSPGRTQ